MIEVMALSTSDKVHTFEYLDEYMNITKLTYTYQTKKYVYDGCPQGYKA